MSRALLAAAAIGVIALSACTPAPADPGGPASSTPSSSQTSTPTNDPQADMRTRLADGLRADNPTWSELVADPATKLAVVEADWLSGWQVIDVQNNSSNHPRRFYAGLSADGTAVRLSANPAGFATMVRDAGVRVDDASTAESVITSYLDVTRDFQQYSYRVDAVSKIKFRPTMTEAQQQQRAAIEKTYGTKITAPAAEKTGTDWAVTAWTVNGTQLIEHDARVAADGSVSDTTTTRESDLPVPQSV